MAITLLMFTGVKINSDQNWRSRRRQRRRRWRRRTTRKRRTRKRRRMTTRKTDQYVNIDDVPSCVYEETLEHK